MTYPKSVRSMVESMADRSSADMSIGKERDIPLETSRRKKSISEACRGDYDYQTHLRKTVEGALRGLYSGGYCGANGNTEATSWR